MKTLPSYFQKFNDKNVLLRIKDGHSDLTHHFHQNINPNEIFKQIDIFCFWDIANINVICRPMSFEEYAASYVKFRNSDDCPNYCTEVLLPILEYTSGMILYRQQIEEIMMQVLKIDSKMADGYRREMGKKNKSALKDIHIIFIQKAIESGYTATAAEELFDTLLKSSTSAFDRDYAVARSIHIYSSEILCEYYPNEEYNPQIDVKADFYTFRNQVREKFGFFYEEQVDLFFERASSHARKGILEQAVAEGDFAYNLCQYKRDNGTLVYLVGFLCELYIQKEDYLKAKHYCQLGLKLLDPEDIEFDIDYNKFREMEEIIRGDEWKNLKEGN